MSVSVDVKELLAAGAHFGHKTSRWHPKMAPYIHSKKGDSHIIDLTKTATMLEEALAVIEKTVAAGGNVMLVSTKRQINDTLEQVAVDTGSPYVVNRWPGGLLTNTKTMGERVKHLKKLEEKLASGELAAKYSKLEVQRFQEEIEEMNVLYGGMKDMAGKPNLVFVADILHDKNAVAEAKKLHIPIIGIVDTNADPRDVTYPIPCNDDALKAVTVVINYIKQAIEAGKAAQKKAPAAEKTEKPEK